MRYRSLVCLVAPLVLASASALSGCSPTDGRGPGSSTAGDASCDAEHHLVEGDLLVGGDRICVPKDPQRVAMLDAASLSLMLTTDLDPPVAYSGFNARLLADGGPELEVESVLEKADDVDDADGNPSLESLAAARPDLIIINDNGGAYGDDIDQYQTIAPTIMTVDQVDARDGYLLVADVLGVSQEATAQWESLDQRSSDLGTMLDEQSISPTSVSILAFFGDLYLFDSESFGASDVLDGTGITVTPEKFALEPLSRERLDLADNDELVVIVHPTNAADFESLADDPLWERLDVVRRGDASDVGAHWFGATPYEYHKVVDDLFRLVAEADPGSVSPNPLLPD